MSQKYAEGTKVTADRTRMEIEKTLARYGSKHFSHMSTPEAAAIEFYVEGRRVRFVLNLPSMNDRDIARTPTGITRTQLQREEAHAKAVRQAWRALLLLVKAKLEGVASGVVTFEEEFLAHTVLPSGRTVSQELMPQIDHAYETGAVQPLQIEGAGR